MWMIGLRQARRPWVPVMGAQSAVGVLFGRTFKKLYDSILQSVLLYGAEAWGCLRCLEPLEQAQLRTCHYSTLPNDATLYKASVMSTAP